MIISDAALLEYIEDFLQRHGMSATRFGEEAASDRHLVRSLRAGGSVTLRRAERILAYMQERDAAVSGA